MPTLLESASQKGPPSKLQIIILINKIYQKNLKQKQPVKYITNL